MNKSVFILVAVVLAGLWAASGITQVDTGTVGAVRYFGAMQGSILREGIHFVRPWPFSEVTKVTVSSRPLGVEAGAASQDMQKVTTKVTVQWSPVGDVVPKLIQGFGSNEEVWSSGILAPAIQEVVKSISAQYRAERLIAERPKVKLQIEEGLVKFIEHTLRQKGCTGAISIANVAITDFHFSDDFDRAIEDKVKAEQDALKAINEKTKRVTQAEAAAKEKTLAADAEAHAIQAESVARAAAIEREAKAITANPEIVQLRIAERWDGKLPTYAGGNAIPMLQIK